MSSATCPFAAEDVEQAVEIDVEEEARERQAQERCAADRRRRRLVDEQPVAFVRVQRHHLVREVADHQARTSRAVVVRRVHAHGRARDPCVVERDARHDADVGERAVPLVAIEPVRLGVVCAEQIEQAVAVVVDQRDAEHLARRIVQPGFLRDVLERAVSLVPVEHRTLALVRLRRAVRLGAAVQRTEPVLLDRPLDVAGDEQVQAAVAVVVEPEGARREPGVADAGLRGDVFEAAASVVTEQAARAERRDVDVGVAVVVEVRRRDAKPVHLDRQARPRA